MIIKIYKKGKKRIIPKMMVKTAVAEDEPSKPNSPSKKPMASMTSFGGSKMEIEKGSEGNKFGNIGSLGQTGENLVKGSTSSGPGNSTSSKI